MKASTEQTIDAMSVLIFVLPVLQQANVLHALKTLPSILLQESARVEIHTDLMAHLACFVMETHLNILMTRQDANV